MPCSLIAFGRITNAVLNVNGLVILQPQNVHPAYRLKTGCWFVGGDNLTRALHVL